MHQSYSMGLVWVLLVYAQRNDWWEAHGAFEFCVFNSVMYITHANWFGTIDRISNEGQSPPPPSTTTSNKQIIQACSMGDQPSTNEQNIGGNLLVILFHPNRALMDLTLCTNHILWVWFGCFLSMPREMTDDRHMALLNFVCSIVSCILLKPIDSEPSIGLAMNVKGSLKPMIKEWLADHSEAPVNVNDVHNFALQLVNERCEQPIVYFDACNC